MKTYSFEKDDLTPLLERAGTDYSEATEAASSIMEDVRARGDAALREYTKKYDGVDITELRVTADEVAEAVADVPPDLLDAIDAAAFNIAKVHKAQLAAIEKKWFTKVVPGVEVGERLNPIESVGCYVPGGLAAYPSTVLMTAIPAAIAGVKRIAVASPPNIPPAVLAACHAAGVGEIYRMGGAQAIAALAYGTETVKPVKKIVGPGNKYVTAAKTLAYGTVDIDMPAGPSEVLIIADGAANPSFIAADILAQAEHDPNAQCILVTDSKELAKKVKKEVVDLAKNSEKKKILKESLKNAAIVLTADIDQAVEFSNQHAPEHLEINTADPVQIEERCVNAGAVFVGPWSCVAAGDYASGGNHVLPTSSTAKFAGQLSVRDFLKSQSIQKITEQGLKGLSPTIITIAEHEGLTEHAKSISRRLV